jgi:hypothetical protein
MRALAPLLLITVSLSACGAEVIGIDPGSSGHDDGAVGAETGVGRGVEAGMEGGGDDAGPASDSGPTSDTGAIACRSSLDCSGQFLPGEGDYCSGPYEGYDLCLCEQVPTCTMDSECDRGSVCREDPFVNPECLMREGDSGLVCTTPCTIDSQCAPTDKCEDGGHCLPRTCGQCPSYFSCASGACVIPNCSTDANCPGGYCVNGTCAGLLGVCKGSCV